MYIQIVQASLIEKEGLLRGLDKKKKNMLH